MRHTRTCFTTFTLVIIGYLALFSHTNVFGQLITFDNLQNLPDQDSSSPFASANGGMATLLGITFPDSFSVSGDQNFASASVPFLTPASGSYSAFGFEDTTIDTSLILQDLQLGNTSLNSLDDGVNNLTIQALGESSQILSSISVVGLTNTQRLVDTSAFNSLSGIAGYTFRIDQAGAENPRFSIDDLRFNAVPEPNAIAILGSTLTLVIGRRRRCVAG